MSVAWPDVADKAYKEGLQERDSGHAPAPAKLRGFREGELIKFDRIRCLVDETI